MMIYHHPRFERSYKKLSVAVQERAEEREQIFRANPFDPRLDTHKLHGRLKDQWSFWITGKIRILFEFDNNDVIFLDIGGHPIYQ